MYMLNANEYLRSLYKKFLKWLIELHKLTKKFGIFQK